MPSYCKGIKKMRYCIDIDGTICTQTPDSLIIPYNEAIPFKDVIDRINKLYDDGNYIIIFTARGSTSGVDWKDFTIKQLDGWGVKYNELLFNKPNADVFIDDKAINIDDWR